MDHKTMSDTPKHPGGRPRLPAGKRNKVVVMVEDAMLALLPTDGKERARWIREAIFDYSEATPETFEAVREELRVKKG